MKLISSEFDFLFINFRIDQLASKLQKVQLTDRHRDFHLVDSIFNPDDPEIKEVLKFHRITKIGHPTNYHRFYATGRIHSICNDDTTGSKQ